MLKNNETLNSVQTVCRIPHNYHYLNQRVVKSGSVEFLFNEERETKVNKQDKPEVYKFGNLVITRTSAIEGGLFCQPSGGILVDLREAMDIDIEMDRIEAETRI